MTRPDFSSAAFLHQHIGDTLAFYEPNVLDINGGFFQHFKDDGHVYDPQTRHLVSSTRFVFNYAMAARVRNEPRYLDWVRHGLDYLERTHRQPAGGYAWILNEQGVVDDTCHAYGLAFVMVAGATALMAGVDQGRVSLEYAFDCLEQHFWEPEYGLYADEATSGFAQSSDYRGQNANMHACEAMLWAHEATGEARYLERAKTLAHSITVRQAALADGLIWEHYTPDWQIDWDYNKDYPKHLFRPWGFQPGHQTEWAKLLLILNRFAPSPDLVTRAQELFDRACECAWDSVHGGLAYGFDPSGAICDGDKYFWVQAESFAAAWLLYQETQEPRYLDWYERIWEYSWTHMVDHKHGAWFRIRNTDNSPIDDLKSPAGKTDYHTMGACYEVLRTL